MICTEVNFYATVIRTVKVLITDLAMNLSIGRYFFVHHLMANQFSHGGGIHMRIALPSRFSIERMRNQNERIASRPQSGNLVGVILCLFASSGICFAQSPDPPISALFSKQWSGANGLVSNEITSSVETESGFLWITSYHGLMRFDGKNVDVFNQRSIPFLKTGAFEKAYEDKQGALWFTSHSNGIVQFKNNAFHPFPAISDKRLSSVHSLLVVDDQSVWVGTTSDGLFLVQGNSVRSIGDSLLRDFTILDIVTDNQKNLWIATDGNGLVEYDGATLKQFTTLDGLQSNFVNALAVTPGDDILVGTTSGLNMVSHQKITSYRPMDEMQINSIKIDSLERIWIGMETGLAKIVLNKQFELANKENGFPYAHISSISIGKEGNIWLSTARSGLIQIEDRGISNYISGLNLPLEALTRIGYGPDRSILVASDKGEMVAFSNGKFTPVSFKKKLSNTIINDIFTDGNGTLWLATQRGILEVSPNKKETWFTTHDGLPSNDIKRIIQDSFGNMWFATQSKGVVKFQQGHFAALYNNTNGLHSNYPGSILADNTGAVYAGTNGGGGGLTVFHPDGRIETRQIRRHDEGILIYSIHKADAGQVWLTTNFGLYHFDGENFKSIQLKTPLTGASFYDWIEDKNENVWVTSNSGVIRMRKADVLQFVAGKIPLVETSIFDNNDGILNKECLATNSLMTSSGIWIPSLGGITIINPYKIIDEGVPSVYIQSLKADELSFAPDSGITIKPGNNRYTLSFTTPSLTAFSRIEFKYKLEKVDRFWVSAGTKRQAEYTNLNPGSYTFQVIASKNGNTWTQPPATVTFTVTPFFYQTSWFLALMITLGVLLLFAIYKWRVRVIEEANRELRKVNGELDRFVYSASHDLRSPLSSILGLIALARVEDAQVARNYFEKIEGCVKLLDKLVRDISDFSSNARAKQLTEPIDFQDLIDESIKTHQYMNGFNEFKWKVTISVAQPFYSDPTRMKIILSNLISNSIKYRDPQSSDPFVAIDILCNKSLSTISISDNGIGIPTEHIDKIFDMFYRAHATSQGSGLGLYIVRETILKLGGKITVDSEPGKGTTFRITLPSLKSSPLKVGYPWKKWSSPRPAKNPSGNGVVASP